MSLENPRNFVEFVGKLPADLVVEDAGDCLIAYNERNRCVYRIVPDAEGIPSMERIGRYH